MGGIATPVGQHTPAGVVRAQEVEGFAIGNHGFDQ